MLRYWHADRDGAVYRLFQAFAELDGGASLRMGDTVRYLLHEYVCILSHTKSLARRPTNTAYWEQTDSASFSF